jgi:6-phosphogluconolactonase
MGSPLAEQYIVPDLETLSREAAKGVCRFLSDAIARKGKASLVLSGGRTPRSLYGLLAKDFNEDVEWDKVDFFWGDERYVSPDSDESNYRLAKQFLLEPLKVSPTRVHQMSTVFDDPSEAASSYERHLRQYFESPLPSFDVLLLGMGVDGHVASLFPGSPALVERQRLVVATKAPAPPVSRLSLTFPAINNASTILILVAGNEKHEVLSWMERSEHKKTFPVSSVTGKDRLFWYIDRAAAEGNS